MRRTGVGIAAAVLALAVGSPASAQTVDDGPYPPTTPPQVFEVEAIGTFCLDDTPFISYDVTIEGFDPPSETIEIRIFDINGDELPAPYSPQVLNSFSGSFLYPGASQDPDDWPGWEEVPPGSGNWVDDTPGALEDDLWRDGLTIVVTFIGEVSGFRSPIHGFRSALVEQTAPLTASADVSYPPPTSQCANPPDTPPPPGTTPPGTTPPELPRTGGGIGLLGQGLALLGVGGLLALIATRRRQHEPNSAT